MFIIVAPSLFIISLANSCDGSNVPKKFKSNTNLTPSGSKSKNVVNSSFSKSSGNKYSLLVVPFGWFPPAPFINISHGPNSFDTIS